ncbi:hypothetical protein E4U60_005678 [Claviceps pazoutovae]|uniref:nicotinamidase n=1 Tax=Claviceps pazoutovae TaxID=1649127 RepID=A0A9P7SEB2_9HYPO|nr:hypothetical protein E4U60_005678 [Claviceps pazoutovae]
MTVFRPALVIVDFQLDFCPPNGSTPVPKGRSIAPQLNTLLSLPFTLKIATRDIHPPNHISFAANHPFPAKPYVSSTEIFHPTDPSRSYVTKLWPVHCVESTPGAQIVPELDMSKVDFVLDKGEDARVEMYSAFYDPFRLVDTGLLGRLKAKGVTDVFVGGLAADFCVRATAEHAVEEGFRTYLVEEATKPVFVNRWDECKNKMRGKGVEIVSMDGPEVARVKALA